jgi:hypothetical protein
MEIGRPRSSTSCRGIHFQQDPQRRFAINDVFLIKRRRKGRLIPFVEVIHELADGGFDGLIVGNTIPKTKAESLEPIQLKSLRECESRKTILQRTSGFTFAAKGGKTD